MGKLNKGLPAGRQGFTLLSVLIAALVVATGSVAVTQLVIRSDRVAVVAAQRFVAVQLAREGLELVRVRRDDNWLARGVAPARTWVAGLCDPGDDVTFIGVRHIALDPQMLRTGTPVIDIDPTATGAGGLFAIPFSAAVRAGEWTHQALAEATPSGYNRLIDIDCAQKDRTITVTSMIRWNSRGQEQLVTLKEQLYDWLP